jgi:hypothetical protein
LWVFILRCLLASCGRPCCAPVVCSIHHRISSFYPLSHGSFIAFSLYPSTMRSGTHQGLNSSVEYGISFSCANTALVAAFDDTYVLTLRNCCVYSRFKSKNLATVHDKAPTTLLKTPLFFLWHYSPYFSFVLLFIEVS